MKKQTNEINPIIARANSKIVSVQNRKFLIGGLTADKVTNDIYQLRTIQQDNKLKIEWKLHKFKNNIFKPRNSFSACGSHNKIYIWGGLQSKQMEQICLDNLIQVDVQKYEMKEMSLKQKVKIHSAALMYNKQENQLIAIGGTNQFSSMESCLYTLKLSPGQDGKYQWKKQRLDCQFHKGYLWQHTAHLSNLSCFSGQQGKYLTVIGGCRQPQSPYSAIVQFNLNTMKIQNSVKMNYGLVSHDSIIQNQEIIIFGGATGGDFNQNKFTLSKGKLTYQKGHKAVGCAVTFDQKGYYVVGGVSGPQSLNNVVIYSKNQ